MGLVVPEEEEAEGLDDEYKTRVKSEFHEFLCIRELAIGLAKGVRNEGEL